jgi:transposase
VADDYADMKRDELIKLAIYQRERMDEMEAARNETDRQNAELADRLSELTEQLRRSNEAMSAMAVQVSELLKQLREKDNKIAELQSTVKAGRKSLFGRKSQKGIKVKDKDDDNRPTPHTDVKDGFDGTPESLSQNLDVDVEKGTMDAADEPSSPQKESRLYRLGKTYRTMTADNRVLHRSDTGKLPEGATVIRTYPRYSYDQETTVTEHEYEIVVYKDKDGNVLCGYFPMDSEKGEPIVESVPGTHAAPGLMAYLVFNRFFLDTPAYRETARLLQERMRLSRQTITNWLEKGSCFFKEVIEYLKDNCLEKDSIVNCDETWCRVKVEGTYRKKYVWCLVNRLAKVAIYCYEDGSRGRKVLKNILEGRELRALQTDGYNVYLYLDNEMLDIDHVCCMAHGRAKFKYAAEIEHDVNARKFLECIGKLYAREAGYIEQNLSPEEIRRRRNSPETTETIIEMRSLLDLMKSENAPRHGSLMKKAVDYLDHFWDQIFLYRKDGNYTIDNSLAERCIRPLANERKNSLFFGSDKMARVSAAYHSVVSTCKLQGYSILEYLKKFFAEIVAGNRDYGKLMPSTIGISANKL